MTIDPGRPVLVTGASGFVGSNVTRLLAARGRRVRAMVRQTSDTRTLEGLPIEIVHGDALDPRSLSDAMRDCASVFHNVVDARVWLSDPAPMRRNNVEGVVNAMDAALANGVRRFVFTSTMGTLGLNPGGLVNEDIPFNWMDRAPFYIGARKEAEDRFLSCCRDQGLPGVALCVANTYGPGDIQPTPHGDMLRRVAAGTMKVALDVAQPTVDIRDVAEAALLAETKGGVGQRYIIANEYADARRFYGMAAARGGVAMPKLLPYRAAYGIAWAVDRWAKLTGRKDNRLTPDAMRLAAIFGPMDNSKARRDFGWCPRPLSETVDDAVEWFAEHGMLTKAQPS